jgi:hypothetical protein
MNMFDDKKRIETAFDGFAETYERALSLQKSGVEYRMTLPCRVSQ